jgi:hypothetical protein
VTPTGARLLLSDEDTTDACCLDRIARSVTLHCIDGRFGDLYPSSTPTTTRLCVSTKPIGHLVPDDAKTMMDVRGRKQTMEVVHLTSLTTTRAHIGVGALTDQLLDLVGFQSRPSREWTSCFLLLLLWWWWWWCNGDRAISDGLRLIWCGGERLPAEERGAP